MKNIVAIVGTNSDKSTNRQLLEYMKSHFEEDANIELLEIKDLPFFDKPANYEVTPQIQEIANKIEEADGVVISTPEYDHAITAALSNALAWLSYKVYPFVDKPVMIVGASYGVLGSSRAQMHLRQILDAPELKARTMPSSEFLLGHSLEAFDENGNLVNSEKVAELENVFHEFVTYIEILKALPTDHEANKRSAEKFIWDKL